MEATSRPTEAGEEPDFLLDGLAAEYNDGYAAGTPMLRRALATFGDGMSAGEELRWLWLASVAAMRVWDDDGWEALSRPGMSSLPTTSARSASFRLRSTRTRACCCSPAT